MLLVTTYNVESMKHYFSSCPIGLECLDAETDNCFNLDTCIEYAKAWPLPYKYERINNMGVLTVQFDLGLYDLFFYEQMTTTNIRITQEYEERGWYQAWVIPEDDYPKVDYCDSIPL